MERTETATSDTLKAQQVSKNPASDKALNFPPQKQSMPGSEKQMEPKPLAEDPSYRPADKLLDQVAVISGGDSGIGRAVAIAYAREGANVAIIYNHADDDAEETKSLVEQKGRRCLLLKGDVGKEQFCNVALDRVKRDFGRIDIIVNNAAEQHVIKSLSDLSEEQLERTFRTNIFGYFFLAKAALKYLQPGSTIINTTSIQAEDPSPELMDYAATKGAVSTFTRALSKELASKGIRVNAVAPGPVWTPLIPASFDEKKVSKFGSNTPLHRAAQPAELAPSYVFLASKPDSSYITGEILYVTGGR